MKINGFFSKIAKKREEKKENFLALEINKETIKAAVWTVKSGEVKVLKLGSIEEWEEEKDFLSAADVTISSVSENITPEPQKVIFGLPEHWVKGEAIASEKKPLLAGLCQKLDLKPVGFVVSLEALITYLKDKQGTPPSAIFIRLSETEIVVSLITLGKVIASHHVGRSQDLALDIKEGLARFKSVDSFPARIILFDGLADFEEAKQQIISFDWQAKLPFLHFPKVESLNRDFVMEAIAVSGGSEVAKSLGFEIFSPKEEKDTFEEKEMLEEKETVTKEPIEEPIEELAEEKVEETAEETAEEKKTPLVIKETKDSEIDESKIETKEKTIDFEEKITSSDLGFVKDKDIKKTQKETPEIKETALPLRIKHEYPKTEGNFKQTSRKSLPSKLLGFFSIFKTIIPRGKLIVIILPIIALVLLTAFLYFYLMKAKVYLFFSSNDIQENISIFLDSEVNEVDELEKIVPGETLTIEVEGESDIETSGEKTIGEKASGKAIIYNKTQNSKNFPAGSVLISSDNLKFILDEEVSIASSSSEETDEGEKTIWGKVTAKVSAASIGEEFNLGGGSNLDFKDYSSSSFSAKTDEGLSGGSSEKIQVVAKKDQQKLLENLTEELEKKGLEEFKYKSEDGKTVLEVVIDQKVLSKDFDKDINDEANQLKLKLKLALTGISFEQEDLQKILEGQFKEEIPDGFQQVEGKYETEIVNSETKDEQTEVDLIVSANLLPDLDKQKIQKDLAGKSEEQARDYLLMLPHLERAKIDISPSFLKFLNSLPRLPNNIQIETTEIE